MDGISRSHAEPVAVRGQNCGAAKILCYMPTVRLRLHEHGLAYKRAHTVRASRAGGAEARRWQRNVERRLRDPGQRGLAPMVQDRAILLHEAGGGPGL